ncbi:hypothetical protein D9M71_677880 [compost metagenome]
MVTLVTDIAVDFSQKGVRRRVGLKQHKRVGAAGAPGRVVLKVNAIRLHTWKDRDHGAIHGVGVPLIDS